MAPNNCDDWAPDAHEDNALKNLALITLISGAWGANPLMHIERFDGREIEGVVYRGWAVWFA